MPFWAASAAEPVSRRGDLGVLAAKLLGCFSSRAREQSQPACECASGLVSPSRHATRRRTRGPCQRSCHLEEIVMLSPMLIVEENPLKCAGKVGPRRGQRLVWFAALATVLRHEDQAGLTQPSWWPRRWRRAYARTLTTRSSASLTTAPVRPARRRVLFEHPEGSAEHAKLPVQGTAPLCPTWVVLIFAPRAFPPVGRGSRGQRAAATADGGGRAAVLHPQPLRQHRGHVQPPHRELAGWLDRRGAARARVHRRLLLQAAVSFCGSLRRRVCTPHSDAHTLATRGENGPDASLVPQLGLHRERQPSSRRRQLAGRALDGCPHASAGPRARRGAA